MEGRVSTYPREKILEIIKKNRDAHVGKHKEAMAGYRDAALSALQKKVKDLEAGQDPSLAIDLDKPTCHVKDYDKVIRSFELQEVDTVELTMDEFSKFVMDEWHWSGREEFLFSNYTGRINK